MSNALPVAVVTGASSGIGLATAQALSTDLPVLAIARRSDALNALADGAPGEIIPVSADLTSEVGRAAVLQVLGERQVSCLVHGAGIYPIDSATTLTADTWRAAMAINLDARLFLTQALAGSFTSPARVVFFGSLSAHKARKGGMAYCTSKAASFMLQQCLRLEYAAQQLAFANVYPGFVDTALMSGALSADRDVLPDAAEYAAAADRGEMISPRTVARFVRWLLTGTDYDAFNRDDWKIMDERYHGQWLGEQSLFAPE